MKKLLPAASSIFGLVLFSISIYVLHDELKEYHFRDILTDILQLPLYKLLISILLTSGSYLLLTVNDILALRYVKHPLPYRKIAFTSFCAYVISNNVGLSLLSGGSIRYRFYYSWGLSIAQITKVILFCSLTFWIGFTMLSGIIFTSMPMPVQRILNISLISTRPLGIICLFLIAGYISLVLFRKKPFTFHTFKIAVPSIQAVMAQISVSSLNWIVAGTALYLLLPPHYGLLWGWFMCAYLLSQLMGISSQVPGGIGVFEASMLLLLPSDIPNPEAFGALVVYRGIYTILPLILTSLLMGYHEIREFYRLRKPLKTE